MYQYLALLSVLLVINPACGSEPRLLTFVVPFSYPFHGPQDVVSIDPSTGKATKLGYSLPTADKLCARVDQKRGLIYVVYSTTNLVKYSMSDGHVVDTYNISYDFISTSFVSWDYNPELNLLYGICLKPDKVAMYWNYTWCYVPFDDSGTGTLKYGKFVAGDSSPPLCGYCSNIGMNSNTFTTGEYWYCPEIHEIVVKNVSSQNGDPWNASWTVEDQESFDSMNIAALVTGKVKEYAIVVHYPPDILGSDTSYVVAKVTPDGKERILAKLPSSLMSAAIGAVPFTYDPLSQMLYILMYSPADNELDYELPDTLVKVNLSSSDNEMAVKIETVKVPLASLGYDPAKFTVFEIHLFNVIH